MDYSHDIHNELKCKKNPISNVCLGGCTITSKTKINFSLWGKQCILLPKWTFFRVLAHCALYCKIYCRLGSEFCRSIIYEWITFIYKFYTCTTKYKTIKKNLMIFCTPIFWTNFWTNDTVGKLINRLLHNCLNTT